MKVFIISFLFIFSGYLIASEKKPSWITVAKHPKYPKSLYWLGVGVGKGPSPRNASIENARREIASQLNATVSGSVEIKTVSLTKGFSEEFSQNVSDKVKTSIKKIDLPGIEIVETYQDKQGTVFALLILKKSRYLKSLRVELDGIKEKAVQGKKQMIKLLDQGNFRYACESYMDYETAMASLLPKAAYYNAVSPISKYHLDFLKDTPKELIASIKSITVKKISGDGQEGKANFKLNQPLKVGVYINDKPIVNTKIGFYFGKTLLGNMETDKNGEALIEITPTMKMASKRKIKINVKVLANILPANFKRTLKAQYAQFQLNIEPSQFNFSLELYGSGSKRAKAQLFSKIIELMKANGGTVQKKSLLHIKGSISPSTTQTVLGFLGENNIHKVNLTLAFTNGRKNVITTTSSSGTGISQNEREGIDKAISNIRINKNQLINAIEKASRISNWDQ